MRVFPAVPEGIRRITPPTGATISGHFVPANVSHSPSPCLAPLTHPFTGQSQHPPLRGLPPSLQLHLPLNLRPRTLAPILPSLPHFPLRLRQKGNASTLFRGS
jgi:hypothetical protein